MLSRSFTRDRQEIQKVSLDVSNRIMNYQAILFDFDGVLCKGRFYEKTLLPGYPEIYNWIQINIFSNRELIQDWMRNRVNSADINEVIARNTGIEYEFLNQMYEESIRRMELEKEVRNLAELIKISGKKIGIVTDNMDVFSRITTPNHQLDKLFDVIINSADYGVLKKEDGGRLFDIALTVLGEEIENSLMIDDSEATIELYKQKGGSGFIYKSPAELKSFLQIAS